MTDRSAEFLKISQQFQLGSLTTESSHPVTANLSETAKKDVAAGLRLLFEVDRDVLNKYREFVESGRAAAIQETVVTALKNGGKLFFTGCGSTGRLSIQLVSIWRDFWQQRGLQGSAGQRPAIQQTGKSALLPEGSGPAGQRPAIQQTGKSALRAEGSGAAGQRAAVLQTGKSALRDKSAVPAAEELEQRAFAVMAGGDYALIKSVEGFEDFTAFGKKQIADLGLCDKDVVFAITEGGETSFVIGTAWQGVEAGAKVYFVYNNPDEVLCQQVQRSREVIQDARIEKINLTTGPMAITGSTRMQATTIQLAVLLTIMEMAVRQLMSELDPSARALPSHTVPAQFLSKLTEAHEMLTSTELLAQLARLTMMEESVYRASHKNNYFADRFGIDVLTDTTERSPTYCTPPFRKSDDLTASESWAFLFVPYAETPRAWEHIIKRRPKCVEWSEAEVRRLVSDDKVARTCETVRKISYAELMRFKVGLDGLKHRMLGPGDCAVAIVSEHEKAALLSPDGFFRTQLETARRAGARTGLVFAGGKEALREAKDFVAQWDPECVAIWLQLPETDFLLDGVTRVALKTLLNSLSTCTMVRLGRVMGNYMIWVVPSNLKLIDRSTRYIQKLTGLDYAQANRMLFEVIEYVEPRMKADQAYPPVVGVSVLRHRHHLDNAQAEQRLMAELDHG